MGVRIKDQTTDNALQSGDFVIVDSQSEGTRKFDLGAELTDIRQDLQELEGGGLSADIKAALDQLAAKVAYIDSGGASYYNDLHNALYPVTPPATLSYITAVYTQSGTVYDTDTLNSLKSDLVVTAHYTGGTSEVVTNYTLSGTLTEGTSTITVSYGGKTTTFNVTVTHQGSGQSDENEWTDNVDYTYTTVTDTYIDQTNGNEIVYAGWNSTPYLYCSGATKLIFTSTTASPVLGASNMKYNAFYDSNKTYIDDFAISGISETAGATCEITVPSNAVYFRASGKYQAYRDADAYAIITPKA